MASLSAMQPVADLQAADHVLRQFCTCEEKADCVISAKELQIVWGSDQRYWKYTKENGMDVAELIEVCWLDVKGKMAMNPLKFVPGVAYAASFVVKRTCGAQNLNNIKLTLEINDGKPAKERVVDLTKIPADKWVALNVADFEANCGCPGTEMTLSLTNHADIWKRGLKIAGIVVHPFSPLKN